MRHLKPFEARHRSPAVYRPWHVLGLVLLLCGHLVEQEADAASKRSPRKPAPPVTYASDPSAMAWASSTAQAQGWDPVELQSLVGQAQRQASVIRLVRPAPTTEPKNWAAYRARFVEPRRIAAGVAFWQQNEAALRRAEQAYGVPPWLVVGIIGVETLYGQHLGQYRVLDALATLAFDFPAEHPRAEQREAFFQSELLAFLQLARASGTPATRWQGSYAGAMGLPQFMPSSWQKHAVDFDGDGRIDLVNSASDAIGSVARFLANHGWTPGLVTHVPVAISDQVRDLELLLKPDIVPTFTADQLREHGLDLPVSDPTLSGPLALVKVENGSDKPSYVVGTTNFYTVTRYNWSSYYALAVIELGHAVEKQR